MPPCSPCTGINGDRVADCQVDVLGANSTAPRIGIFAKRAISGSVPAGVGNFRVSVANGASRA